jgi:hypothetical protein
MQRDGDRSGTPFREMDHGAQDKMSKDLPGQEEAWNAWKSAACQAST